LIDCHFAIKIAKFKKREREKERAREREKESQLLFPVSVINILFTLYIAKYHSCAYVDKCTNDIYATCLEKFTYGRRSPPLREWRGM